MGGKSIRFQWSHHLSIEGIHFKMLMCAFKVLHGLATTYTWANCWASTDLNAHLRSANSGTLLCVPSTKNKLGESSFSSAGPQTFVKCSIAGDKRSGYTKNGFKRLLNTHLYLFPLFVIVYMAFHILHLKWGSILTCMCTCYLFMYLVTCPLPIHIYLTCAIYSYYYYYYYYYEV